MKVKSKSEVAQSCPTLSDPMVAAHQAPPSMGFSRQECWSGVPLPSPHAYLGLTKFYTHTHIHTFCVIFGASLIAQLVKNLPAVQENRVLSLGWEDPLEEEMATHSSILAWRIPWTKEPGRL